MKTENEAREQLWSLIKHIKFAMFTTRHINGHLHSRPMTTQNRTIDEDDRLWFFMAKHSDAVAALGADAEVNVGYADPDADRYVSVSGRARLHVDRARVRDLWSKSVEAWFPAGPSDSSLALVEVRITHAHYWDTKASRVTQLYAMAKSILTGTPPHDPGSTGEVRMR